MSETESRIACPHCLERNEAERDFCVKCGAPLSAMSVTGPWERIQSEGFAYRQAVSGPPKTIVLVGMWLLFGPIFTAAPVVGARLVSSRPELDPRTWGGLAGTTLLWCISAALLFRVTKNYVQRRKNALQAGPGCLSQNTGSPAP